MGEKDGLLEYVCTYNVIDCKASNLGGAGAWVKNSRIVTICVDTYLKYTGSLSVKMPATSWVLSSNRMNEACYTCATDEWRSKPNLVKEDEIDKSIVHDQRGS